MRGIRQRLRGLPAEHKGLGVRGIRVRCGHSDLPRPWLEYRLGNRDRASVRNRRRRGHAPDRGPRTVGRRESKRHDFKALAIPPKGVRAPR
jgi:hypothetical protein